MPGIIGGCGNAVKSLLCLGFAAWNQAEVLGVMFLLLQDLLVMLLKLLLCFGMASFASISLAAGSLAMLGPMPAFA